MAETELIWVRPWLALVLLPWILALVWWWRTRRGQGRWRRLVDAHLLDAVTTAGDHASDRRLLLTVGLIGLLITAALAGPSWRTQPVPLFRDLNARIVVLDVSPSMRAIDVSPDRLTVAKTVVTALLRHAPGRQLGLVVFAGDAFTVAPLTRDAATLLHLLHSIDHTTLPRPGARVDLGLAKAASLLEAADIARGDVYLVGDSPGDARAIGEAIKLQKSGFPLSVIAVGSEQGGPIRLEDGQFANNGDEIIVTRLNPRALEKIAEAGRGTFEIAKGDLASALATTGQGPGRTLTAPAAKTKQLPVDEGYWLVLLALPLFMLLCRRGWLMSIGWLVFALPGDAVYASSWSDWWARPDQQAAALASQLPSRVDPTLEAKLEAWPRWRALVLMRAGEYARAARLLADFEDADSHYNRGNALALAGNLTRALRAYDTALAQRPNLRDALFNRALVREVLARQREQQTRGQSRETSEPETGAGDRERAPDKPDSADQQTRSTQSTTAPESRDAKAADTDSSSARPQGQEDATATEQAKASDIGTEMQRLEGLLTRIPDQPGALLKNRFAIEFKLRSLNHADTGAKW